MTIYYCLTCKTRVPESDVIMEEPTGHGYKHQLWYLQSGKQSYVLHPVRFMIERDK